MGIEEKDGGKRLEVGGEKSCPKPQANEVSSPRASSVHEDERYYVPCPKRKNQEARIPIARCFDCEFSTGDPAEDHVKIGCGFPVGRVLKKPWRRKGSNYPRVNKIARDGLS